MPTRRRRELGSTFTSPIDPTSTFARDAASVSSPWPTWNLAASRNAFAPTRGAPATAATDHAGVRGTIRRSAIVAKNATDAATAKGVTQRQNEISEVAVLDLDRLPRVGVDESSPSSCRSASSL